MFVAGISESRTVCRSPAKVYITVKIDVFHLTFDYDKKNINFKMVTCLVIFQLNFLSLRSSFLIPLQWRKRKNHYCVRFIKLVSPENNVLVSSEYEQIVFSEQSVTINKLLN